MAMVGASGAGGGLAFGGEGSASSVAGRLLSSLGPAKIGREAPAFVHVVHRRKEEQAVRGSWVVYLMCLLFVAAVVIVPPTWRVGSGAGGAIPPPPPFSEDLITPILDAYVFAKDWLIAGTGGESMCALTQHLADSGRTLYTVALARGARCESSGSGAGKGSGGGGDGSSGDDGRGGGKDVGASARAQTVTAYTPGGMSAHYATHRPDAVLLLLWGSLPHDLGSRFKRMVSELAKMAHRKVRGHTTPTAHPSPTE
jgi:hypothetical protein|uniref:Uncharacterized protein n=1 Tax=Mantoniella antarctica TaxID=81844 RepID=A0A7S0SK16_9CHLO|mmetsp:Transcript_40258/g.64536  ORF Transcript_40258/g.64536 Transcript_40258/m.64536 type:complete len:255 (+) Transcript_40258:242-1006(+)|eukprot:CAMPEP_0181365472 /NCGR_PEP_ID=MMETSP1106-20121128/10085_1 /TAXON_ID=81844 /ORGANISM="Mantoniella antarctica, Strain SL-175" /LENGTH=254 /DNA_ID=CAMNT_0023480549 /DNA_START=187 /DNA_END=951 /DNA_ORIENTATION=+